MTELQPVDARTRSSTRRSLHGVAELVLAGPQFRQSGSIELRVSTGGFATTMAPDVQVAGLTLVAGDVRTPISNGATYAQLADSLGLTASRLDDVYGDGPGLTESDRVEVEAAAAAEIAEAFRVGEQAMLAVAPDQRPILWPEHFDIGITLDEVNYGVSPGDASIAEPYAYVGPWRRADYSGDFWNAPFGAARHLTELGGVDELVTFFSMGRELTS